MSLIQKCKQVLISKKNTIKKEKLNFGNLQIVLLPSRVTVYETKLTARQFQYTHVYV